MTTQAKEAINNMNEEQLRKYASVHYGNKEIVEYIDTRLDKLNVGAAIVENGELDDFGDE